MIQTKGGEPLLSPGDISEESAFRLIEAGDAVLVRFVRLTVGVQFPDLGVRCKDGTVLELVTPEHEVYGKSLLNPRNKRAEEPLD